MVKVLQKVKKYHFSICDICDHTIKGLDCQNLQKIKVMILMKFETLRQKLMFYEFSLFFNFAITQEDFVIFEQKPQFYDETSDFMTESHFEKSKNN